MKFAKKMHHYSLVLCFEKIFLFFYVGDTVDVFYDRGSRDNDKPIYSSNVPFTTFTGFRVAPA